MPDELIPGTLLVGLALGPAAAAWGGAYCVKGRPVPPSEQAQDDELAAAADTMHADRAATEAE